MTTKEGFLHHALGVFMEMVEHGECSTQDISYFCGLSKYELERRGANIDRQRWFTKSDVARALCVSTSTIDRYVSRGLLQRGKKMVGHKALVWSVEQVEQLKELMLLKAK